MKKKIFKIMALCLCTISLGVSLCSCGILDSVFDIVDAIIDANKSSVDSGSGKDDDTDDVPVQSPYVEEKTIKYDGYNNLAISR